MINLSVISLVLCAITQVPQTLEIALVKATEVSSQFAGLFLYSSISRMVRPVTNLALNRVEMIGSFEQAYMNVAVIPEEVKPGVKFHYKIGKISSYDFPVEHHCSCCAILRLVISCCCCLVDHSLGAV